jgi:hypothetical protein
MKKKKFYVYVLQNPKKPLRFNSDSYKLKYEPFYVGKGSGSRAEVHYNNFLKKGESHNTKLLAEITKLKSYGVQPLISKIFESYDEEKVYEKEAELISHYGFRYKDGLLVNASTGKAGGWGGELNPTYDRMEFGTHNFQVKNPQLDTPKILKLKKMILEVDKEDMLNKPKWLSRTGYSNTKALKIGIKRVIERYNLPYKINRNTLKKNESKK